MAEPMDIVTESPERMDTSPHHFVKTHTQKRRRRIKLKNAKDKKKQGKKNAKSKKTHTKKNALALNEKKRKEERQIIVDNARGLNEHHFIWISHGETLQQPLQKVPFEKFPYEKLLQYGIDRMILVTSDKNETIPQKICNKEYSYAERTVPANEYLQKVKTQVMENDEIKTVINKAFVREKPEWTKLPDYRFSVSEDDEKNQVKNSMGLWYCTDKIKRIFTYDDILKKTKNGVRMTIYDVHDIIFSYCKSKKIPTDTVTVSIWACRAFCEDTKVPINVVNKKKGGGSFKKLPEPMSSEEMAQFLSVCVMPPKEKPSNVKTKTRTQTKTRKHNKKRAHTNSSKV